eukprot:2724458-Pleurochrysis_carterae.AAC.1
MEKGSLSICERPGDVANVPLSYQADNEVRTDSAHAATQPCSRANSRTCKRDTAAASEHASKQNKIRAV